jgi:hypothetical protein
VLVQLVRIVVPKRSPSASMPQLVMALQCSIVNAATFRARGAGRTG